METFKIIKAIESLAFLKKLLSLVGRVKLYGELEIEPFTEFSISFQANYWFIKYMLLSNGTFELDEESSGLLNETNINVIWASLTNDTDFIIECKDGDWYVTFLRANNSIMTFLKEQKLI